MLSRRLFLATLTTTGVISAPTRRALAMLFGGAGAAGGGGVVLLTTRTITNTSASSPVPANSPVRFGFACKKGDVPAGSSLKVNDGAGNTVALQVDARSTWADGSLKFAEVICTTARSVAASGADTFSIYKTAGAFNNTLPNGKTPTQLLTDLQSFVGAQALKISLSQPIAASAASNVYTAAGPWVADFNTDAARGGNNLQIINQGPCCMGYRVFGRFNDGTRDHIHLYPIWYVWLWLDPATGAIRDVEWISQVHNALLSQGADGTAYSTFPPDRYSYVATLLNQTTTIATTGPSGNARQQATVATISASSTTLTVQTSAAHSFQVGDWVGFPSSGFLLAGIICQVATVPDSTHFAATADSASHATTIAASATFVSGAGGHHARASWFTARADGKPRWAAAVSIEPTLLITLDSAARAYVYASGMCPKWDESYTMSASGVTCSYVPFSKGFWGGVEGADSDYTTNVGIDSGGASIWIGLWPSWCVRGFVLQTSQGFQNARINALHFCGHPTRYLDSNGRITALDGQTYAGLNTSNTTFCVGEASSAQYVGIVPRTEIHRLGAGYWNGVNGDIMDWATTHWPSPAQAAYLQEGYRHLLDILIGSAEMAVMNKSASISEGNLTRQRSSSAGVPSSPNLVGTYNGVIIGSTGQPREDAWGLREAAYAAAMCPDALADGTACGEKAWLKQVVSQSYGWAADYLTHSASANMLAIGAWDFKGTTEIVEWMLGYFSQATGQAYKMLGDEVFGANIFAVANHVAKFWAGAYDGHVSLYLLGNQEMGTFRYGVGADFVPDFSYIGGTIEVPSLVTEPPSQLLFDAATGYLTTVSSGTSTPLAMPFTWSVGDRIILTRTQVLDSVPPGAGNMWPLEIKDALGAAGSTTSGVNSEILYISEVDTPNNRFRVSFTDGGASVTSWSASSTKINYYCVKLQAAPSTSWLGATGSAAHFFDVQAGIRSLLSAGVTIAGLSAADSNIATRLATVAPALSPFPMDHLVV